MIPAVPMEDNFSDPPSMSLGELRKRMHDFRVEYLKNRSKDTIGTYGRSLNEFERWFIMLGGRSRFTKEDIQQYKDHLEGTKRLSESSVSTYLTAVRKFFEYLVSIGVLKENPAIGVKGNRRPTSHSRQPLTESEVSQLLEHVEENTQIGKRDTAIIYLMMYAGMSEIEIVRADRADLDQTFFGVHLRIQGKGRTKKDQQVPVDPIVMEKLDQYLETNGRMRPETPLFISHGHRSEGARLNTRSVRSRITECLRRAGIQRPGISPHSLTHTAPLIWLNQGMSVEEVKRRMRHGSIETTMIHSRKQELLKRDLSLEQDNDGSAQR